MECHGVRYPKIPICPKVSVTSFLFRALKPIILFAHVLVSSPSLQPKYRSNPCYDLLGVCAPSQTYGQYGMSFRGLCALSFADINISSSSPSSLHLQLEASVTKKKKGQLLWHGVRFLQKSIMSNAMFLSSFLLLRKAWGRHPCLLCARLQNPKLSGDNCNDFCFSEALQPQISHRLLPCLSRDDQNQDCSSSRLSAERRHGPKPYQHGCYGFLSSVGVHKNKTQYRRP
jgi:hypothetical protein